MNTIEEARELNKVIEEMAALHNQPGWQRFYAYLEMEERRTFDAMFKATSGDLMIKASAAYTTVKNIKDLTGMWARTNLERLNQLKTEGR